MKNVTKLAAVFVYLFILSFLLDFQLKQLFDLKQVCLVLIGMVILFLPGYRRGESKRTYAGALARCALFASYIQTFILIFLVLSTDVTIDTLMQEIARNCRPLLYGICLWVIFSGDTKIMPVKKEMSKNNNDEKIEEKETNQKKYLTATETYEAYRKLGLTNREAELAVQIERGLSNGEIAAELNISETTVKKHISNIFEKLNINRREQIKDKLP